MYVRDRCGSIHSLYKVYRACIFGAVVNIAGASMKIEEYSCGSGRYREVLNCHRFEFSESEIYGMTECRSR